MNEPTGSPANRGYACAMKSTRSASRIDVARERTAVCVLEGDSRTLFATLCEADSSRRVDAHRAGSAPCAAPPHHLAHRRHPWMTIDEGGNQALVRVQRAGKAERGREVGMPDADPQAVDLTRAIGEREGVPYPRRRIFLASVFAQGAVHPREWHLIKRQRAPLRITPHRQH